jgi:hypothetical protein
MYHDSQLFRQDIDINRTSDDGDATIAEVKDIFGDLMYKIVNRNRTITQDLTDPF